jgi:hypothetical protein
MADRGLFTFNVLRALKRIAARALNPRAVLALSAALALFGCPPIAHAQASAAGACAVTPADAWANAQAAVKSGDAGRVMLALTPEKRARESSSFAVGAHMVLSISELSGDLSKKPEVARKAKEAEKKLSLELDAILKKHKAPSIAQIGKPILERVYAPDVLKLFSGVDHAAYGRDMDKFFVKVEAAAKDAGVKSESPPKLDELVVGMGSDLPSPLTGLQTSGDAASATAGKTPMQFMKLNGCWLVHGRPEK